MKTEDYIRGEITTHLGVHNITYQDQQIDEIVEAALSGTGAFQIIFEQVFDPFCEDGDERYFLERWKPLDRSLIMKTGKLYGTTMYFTYSYDGGKRYQWSEMETIVIDQAALREIKLGELGL